MAITMPKLPRHRDPLDRRAKRKREPSRYRGGHRGPAPVYTPKLSARAPRARFAAEAFAPAPPPPLGRRLTPLKDRPNTMRPTPRERFQGTPRAQGLGFGEDRPKVPARQRFEGVSRARGAQEATHRRPTPARSRFPGQGPVGVEHRPEKSVGRARRPRSPLPGASAGPYKPDAEPQLQGRGFAGGYFGPGPIARRKQKAS
jgi:hypothetical protein